MGKQQGPCNSNKAEQKFELNGGAKQRQSIQMNGRQRPKVVVDQLTTFRSMVSDYSVSFLAETTDYSADYSAAVE